MSGFGPANVYVLKEADFKAEAEAKGYIQNENENRQYHIYALTPLKNLCKKK